MKDVRFALRQFIRRPGFTAAAVLTLALGIGATTAIFSVVYGVLINPYPYDSPEEIWAPGVRTTENEQTMRPYRMEEFSAISSLSCFAEVMGTHPASVLLTGSFAPEIVAAPRLSMNAFQFLAVPPVVGRTFGPGDVGPGGQPEALTVISYNLWQRLFGGDPGVLGQSLRLDDRPYSIIGVMPPRFGWWTSDGLWLPLDPAEELRGGIFPIVRLQVGVAPEAANQQLQGLQRELARLNPAGFPKGALESTLTNYLDMTVASGQMRQSLQVLLGAVAFLLLIACANVANLQLARAMTRSREMAIRASIGAGRFRLVRQMLTESVLLALAGGALGLLFASLLTRLAVVLMPTFYVPNEARIEVNAYVLLFSAGIALLTGIVFGLVPALHSSRARLNDALKDESRGSTTTRGGYFRGALVVGEVALSVVLLVGAGLTIRSFVGLQSVELGFQPEQVLRADYRLPAKRYSTREQRLRFDRELLERLQLIPGIEAVELGNGGLPFGGPSSSFSLEGRAGPESETTLLHLVSADYLTTLKIPLLRGRMLNENEVNREAQLAVINEAAARFWPQGRDPIGTRMSLDLLKNTGGGVLAKEGMTSEVTVIGVFGNTRNDGVAGGTRPVVLVPYTLVSPPERSVALRTHTDPAVIADSLRREFQAMDPLLPVGNLESLEESVRSQTVQPRFTMALFSLFAFLGLGIAALGIYSVISYLVTRRTREIGVRIALGAQRRQVLRLVLRDGVRLAGLGILAGVLASLITVRLVASRIQLFQVDSFDPISFGSVILLLGIISAAACWLPARRATRVDPMVALRDE